jgi:alcohol dehydrogenase
LPENIDFVTAASLGCRFITSFRAVVDQGKTQAGQWVAVHGCGGVGLSAIMIANSLGAKVIGIDIDDRKLEKALSLGACATVNTNSVSNVVEAVRDLSKGGVHVSIDALGHPETCFNSVANLRKRGKHIQVGLMLGEHCHSPVPMDRIIANELEIIGSHGMQAHRFSDILEMIEAKKLQPEKLIENLITLEESLQALPDMNKFEHLGVTVINRF